MAGVDCGAKLDFSKISEADIIADSASGDGRAWIRADVEEKIYFLMDSTLGDNVPGVVIKFNDGCFASACPVGLDKDINPTLLFTSQALNATAFVANNEEGDEEPNNGVPPEAFEGTSLQDTSNLKTRNICTPQSALSGAAVAVDSASINDKGNQPAAVLPAAAVIPMKSNIKTYGPFASNNFHTSAGGIGVEVNQDLSPWVFGSTSYMIEAGNAIAQSANIGLLYGETGGVTVAGLPQYAFGQIFGATGPNLTGINVTFGSNGITTSYDFRTFTPKFGGLTRQFIEKFKIIAKHRTEQLRMLRNNQITQNKIGRKVQRFNYGKRTITEKDRPASDKASLSRILVGGIDTNATAGVERVVVGTSTLAKAVVEMMSGYAEKAYMGLDAFFTPVSLHGDGGLPGLASFTPKDHKASTPYSHPPCSISGQEAYNINITQNYLNPLTNNFASGEHHHNGSGYGHSLDLVGRGSGIPKSGLITNFYSQDDPKRYSDDYRFLALRGPLVLQSWGYDTNGKPVPNESENTDRFATNWLSKPSTWPVGPVDLRFDKTRGVWTAPPPYKIVVAKVLSNILPYGTGSGQIIVTNSGQQEAYSELIYDKDGNPARADAASSLVTISLQDRLGQVIISGSTVYAYYDTYAKKYLALSSGASQGVILKGVYTGSWNKGATKPVNLADSNATITVTNRLKDLVPVTTQSETNVCYVINVGGNNYDLVSAECL